MAKKVKEQQSNEEQFELQTWYSFDWSKVETLEDLKIILGNLGMTVSDKSPAFDILKKYLYEAPAYTTN